jgi:hypothetical protein
MKKEQWGKAITKLAQDLVAKKLRILDDQNNLDHMTLQHYLDKYKLPLFEQSMEAILSLTEVAVEKGKKKSKKLKKDKTAEKGKTVENNAIEKKHAKKKKKHQQGKAP